MRFKQFILEQQEFDLEKFFTECAPILKQYKRAGAFLYRGAPRRDYWSKDEFTERSKPRDTPLAIHNAMNFNFKKEFGIEPRNWHFASFQPGQSGMYGLVGAVFPTGENFDFVYSPKVMDATATIEELKDQLMFFNTSNPKEINEEIVERIKQNFVNEFDYVHTKDIIAPLSKKFDCEVMFKCEFYYQIRDGKILNTIKEKMRDM